MTPYKEHIFRELEQVLANAAPEQIERLLSDIATGQYSATAQTRAGTNDNHCNVTDINDLANARRVDSATARSRAHVARMKSRALRAQSEQLSIAARDVRRMGYSS